MFERAPYINCPSCHKKTFGILSVYSHHYVRRCKNCRHTTAGLTLPPLNKKIIYLDQMAISNMMKATNPKDKAHSRASKDPFWQKLHSTLHQGFSLQLLICPNSNFHFEESLLAPYYNDLKKMYEAFSGGMEFRNNEAINRFQLNKQLKRWLGEECDDLLAADVIKNGEINAWLDIAHISLNLSVTGVADELRSNKIAIAREMEKNWKQWQEDKGRDFQFWVDEEVKGYPRMLHAFKAKQQDATNRLMTGEPVHPGRLIPNFGTMVLYDFAEMMKKHGVSDNNINKRLQEFYQSEEFRETPHIKISSMMIAAMARRAASGKKKPPDGLLMDTNIISTVSPYCDALFIDDECRRLLQESPLYEELIFDARVYSNNNRDDFITWIESQMTTISEEHKNAVSAIYGEHLLK